MSAGREKLWSPAWLRSRHIAKTLGKHALVQAAEPVLVVFQRGLALGLELDMSWYLESELLGGLSSPSPAVGAHFSTLERTHANDCTFSGAGQRA